MMNERVTAIDYVEFYVGNAIQSALFYQFFFGFKLIAYSNAETGNNETASYVLSQGAIKIVVTAAYRNTHPVANHVSLHGDSVKAVAFTVQSAEEMHKSALTAGAESVMAPANKNDQFGTTSESVVGVYGNTTHVFIERSNYTGIFKPGYTEYTGKQNFRGIFFNAIDHITANIEAGSMSRWVSFYREVFGFETLVYFDGNDIQTEYAAMSSIVVTNKSGSIKLPLTEPVNRLRKSQIQEFIDHNSGAGIQHLAFHTNNIVATVEKIKKNGIPLLKVPGGYYENLHDRIEGYTGAFEKLIELDIMVDKEADGFLLQSFTKPVLDRPTYFIEFIQRDGANSFGKGNVKALFEALMREQDKREHVK